MGWFGSGVNHEPYDANGNPLPTGHESRAILESFGTNDLDHVLAAYAPGLRKVINNQTKGLRETKQMVADLTEIIKKQNQQIEEMSKKINALER